MVAPSNSLFEKSAVNIFLIVFSSIVFTSTVAFSAPLSAEAIRRGDKIASTVCISCHDQPDGQGKNKFPNLAGQKYDYLEDQLRNFRDHKRTEQDAHDFMWGFAALMDDDLIAGLANYFHNQKPSSGKSYTKELSSSESSGTSVTVKTAGSKPCPIWVSDNEDKFSWRAIAARNWLFGLLTGLAMGTSIDFIRGVDTPSLIQWMDNFCEKNPQSSMEEGAYLLARLLSEKRPLNIPLKKND